MVKCVKCGSENVNVQVVTEATLKEKKHGALYWLFIGWWLKPLLWLFLTFPMIIITIFKPKKYTAQTKTKKVVLCNKNWVSRLSQVFANSNKK